MKTLKDFIQLVIKDLNLGKLTPSMEKTIEFRIEKMVDKQIQSALEQTLSETDWEIFDAYKKDHPEASSEEAISQIIQTRPEIQNTLEDTLDDTYNQLMMMGNAAEVGISMKTDTEEKD